MKSFCITTQDRTGLIWTHKFPLDYAAYRRFRAWADKAGHRLIVKSRSLGGV